MSQHHRDLGITLLDAKYLDPACHKGCQGLVHKREAERLLAELTALRARVQQAEELAKALKDTTDFLNYEVYREVGGDEGPAEPADSLSYGAASLIRSNNDALAAWSAPSVATPAQGKESAEHEHDADWSGSGRPIR
jgi:hypothetical protein